MKKVKAKKNYPKKMLGQGKMEDILLECPGTFIGTRNEKNQPFTQGRNFYLIPKERQKLFSEFYYLKCRAFGSSAFRFVDADKFGDRHNIYVYLNTERHLQSFRSARQRTEKMLISLQEYRNYLKETIFIMWDRLQSFFDGEVIGLRRVSTIYGPDVLRFEKPVERPGEEEGKQYQVWDFVKSQDDIYCTGSILPLPKEVPGNALQNITSAILEPDEKLEAFVKLFIRRIEREVITQRALEELAKLYRQFCFAEAEEKEPRKIDHLYVIQTNLGVHHIGARENGKDAQRAAGLQFVDLREKSS